LETVVSLSKLQQRHICLDVSTEEIGASSAQIQSEATYSNIKKYVLDNFNLKVSSLYISQVKDKQGLDKRDNYNLPKSDSYR